MTNRTVSMPAGIRSDIELVSRIDERTDKVSGWNNIKGFSEAATEIQQKLKQAFPNGPNEMLDLMSDGDGEHLHMNISTSGKTVIKVAGKGGSINSLGREFNMDNGNLSLLMLTLKETGGGKGTRILLGTYEVAKRLGMKTMTLRASWDGTYVWARAGFLPRRRYEWDQVREGAKRQFVKDRATGWLRNMDSAMAAEIEALLSREDSKALWELTDLKHEINGQKVVPELLYFNRWSGVFKIGNPEQEARLKEYAEARGVAI